MKHLPRKSVTSVTRDAIDGLRRSRGWSQSAMADDIVTAHKAIDGERVTEILFEETRPGRDEVARQKINAQRLYRWLDDSDSPGHMPANFLPSVLAALPVELRVQLANEILAPCGLVARIANAQATAQFDPLQRLDEFLREMPQAKQALMRMSVCDSPETARTAVSEIDDVIRVAKATRDEIEASMSARAGLQVVA